MKERKIEKLAFECHVILKDLRAVQAELESMGDKYPDVRQKLDVAVEYLAIAVAAIGAEAR